jgi:lysozyme family protein
MSEIKQKVIDAIIAVEGGYVSDPNDSGGETNFGVTEQVARAAGYDGPMREMPREVAEQIYSRRYWDAVKGDQLAELSERIAEEVVDTGVNMGVGRAGKFLQQALNVLNNRGKLYSDISVDGAIGPGTLTALKTYLEKRDEAVMLKALNVLQGAFYIDLATRRDKDESFLYGWLKNRVNL